LRLSKSRAFRWQQRTTRRFDVPSRLLAPAFGCTFGQPEVTGACLDAVTTKAPRGSVGAYTGTYQPYAYVPPGLAMRVAESPRLALGLGRAAILVMSAGLLVAAVWLLWTPAAATLSLLGLVAAISPMVLFLSSVLSPSGPEIAGAICFCAALLRLARKQPPPRWAWVALGVSGAVLACARALGPAFVVVDATLVAGFVGLSRLVRAGQAARTQAVAASGAIAFAAIASLVWEFTRQPRPQPTGDSALDAIGPSLSRLPELARQVVGVFGALDAPMPAAGYVLWALLLALLAGAAFVLGSRRERIALSALGAVVIVVILVMSVVYREIGPLHGRYALPVIVLLPLAAGEVVLRRRARLPAFQRAALVSGSFTLAAGVHALGWWASGRRFAVGADGSWLFPWSAEWSPPLGWAPWLALVAIAVAALVTAGVRGRHAYAAQARTG
jgi:hypothetical protein